MRKMILSFLMAVLIFLVKAEAQTSVKKEDSCQPSAEEILSVIKSVYNWSPSLKGVSIAGEIQGGFGELRLPEEELSLTIVLSKIGGISKTPVNTVYVVRQSLPDKTKNSKKIDLRNIKQKLIKDIKLEKGDVIFVPRGCANGKLLPPTKPQFPKIWFDGTGLPLKYMY